MKDGFSTKQELALDTLLKTPNVAEAARISGLARSTMHKYLSNPGFKAELFRRRRDQMAEGSAELRAGVKSAARELREIIEKKSTSDQVKINAINSLLTHAARFAELTDIEEQLADIVARQDEIDKRNRGIYT